MIQYQLIELKERGIFINAPEEHLTEFTIGWEFQFRMAFPDKEKVEIIIDAKVNIEGHPNSVPLVHLIVSHFFHVSDTGPLQEGKLKEASLNLTASLVGISLGTVRGLAYARSHSILGRDVFMPVVNPLKMVKEVFAEGK
ncbi:hypothetical protein [Neolewinella persica]|uniref:hypothetical protein n=1 Tax=Neolewinella persica TaxID=70998 RepID=UPI00036509CA|nr:hypothetical protein [Neolewinella persica]